MKFDDDGNRRKTAKQKKRKQKRKPILVFEGFSWLEYSSSKNKLNLEHDSWDFYEKFVQWNFKVLVSVVTGIRLLDESLV